MTDPPVPCGFRLTLDVSAKQLNDELWFGGSPPRVLRLTPAGRRAMDELHTGPVTSPSAGRLARRLTDAGLAHPTPPPLIAPGDVTVVVPVRDRPAELDRCLAALGNAHPVLVVDDCSTDAETTEHVCASHGATLVRRDVNGGPAAARNTGLEAVGTEFVAFLDSDCEPAPAWIEQLLAHLADPLVAAAAPRIVPVAPDTWAGRYTRTHGLDLGDRAARVAPGSRVGYVPTAALVARTDALRDLARDGEVFDERLPVGEDVDLVWRLHEAGWRVRYEPSVRVRHHEPRTWPALLARRFRYGTSAGDLARRHPTAMAPLVLHPWPAVAVAGVLARRPLVAAAGFGAAVITMTRTLHRADVPTNGVVASMARATHQTWLGIGRYAGQFAAPALAVAAVAPGRRGRRLAAASLLLGPPLASWARDRDALDPLRFAAAELADEIAYGAGVWTGSIRARTAVPLRPVVTWRPLRTDTRRSERHG
jgi:mycofactocin system glycosyltransferase